MLNEILLLSKNDIPFIEAQIILHQPTLKEVAFIGEENFYLGCELLTFSKDSLKEQDKIGLENKSDFDILMSVVEQNQISKACLLSILTLIFPTYKIDMGRGVIVLMDENGVQYIRAEHFDALKQIITEMFCLNRKNADGDDYNPGNEAARKMAERFRKARQKKAEMRGEDTSKINILSRYISILSVGLGMDINELMNYTVYQLFDVFERFELKMSFDYYVQAKMAGAKDLEEVDNWMKDIHQ